MRRQWGSRGRWFESSHSDQKRGNRKVSSLFFLSAAKNRRPLAAAKPRFNSPQGGKSYAADFPTGSNPVTRTKVERGNALSVFLFFIGERPRTMVRGLGYYRCFILQGVSRRRRSLPDRMLLPNPHSGCLPPAYSCRSRHLWSSTHRCIETPERFRRSF